MSRGAPDYSNVKAAVPLHRLDDHAELAARLGSPVTYDRPGGVYFLSNFGFGLGQFGRTVVGDGAYQVATPETFFTGPFCLAMQTSNVTGEVSTAQLTIPVPTFDTKMGLEVAFAIPDAEIGFAINLLVYEGIDMYQYILRYTTDNGRLQVMEPLGGGVLLDGFEIRKGSRAWHKMKIVMDLEEHKYVRALFDEHRFDTSEYAALHFEPDETNRLDIRLTAWSLDDTSRLIYWDSVIVTQGEP